MDSELLITPPHIDNSSHKNSFRLIIIKNIVNRVIKLEGITKPDAIKDPI
jgi:hypothetical protein